MRKRGTCLLIVLLASFGKTAPPLPLPAANHSQTRGGRSSTAGAQAEQPRPRRRAERSDEARAEGRVAQSKAGFSLAQRRRPSHAGLKRGARGRQAHGGGACCGPPATAAGDAGRAERRDRASCVQWLLFFFTFCFPSPLQSPCFISRLPFSLLLSPPLSRALRALCFSQAGCAAACSLLRAARGALACTPSARRHRS